ncbi:CGH_1_HP_G0103020.mRNA.1.CDS.1 [Saccharomyces cerevisiae]|nr:CGH_1_HP_G0103020.mRNA.1.CDS.1 [Saccharomyces cerevisiae]CAI6950153.1 CGH_1_HP_G0103020.mRNA.1.CDS.1 [Saccharomyces cerevisiae]
MPFSSDFDLYYIIEKKPHFIDNSFSLMNSDLQANSVGKCIVSLLLNIYEKHFKKNESFVQEWIQLWKSCALKLAKNLGIEEEPFCDNKYTTVDSLTNS